MVDRRELWGVTMKVYKALLRTTVFTEDDWRFRLTTITVYGADAHEAHEQARRAARLRSEGEAVMSIWEPKE